MLWLLSYHDDVDDDDDDDDDNGSKAKSEGLDQSLVEVQS